MSKTNLWNMQSLDVFLNSLSDAEYRKYIKLIEPKNVMMPLKSWGIADSFFTTDNFQDINTDLEILNQLSLQYYWNNDLADVLKHSYDALVLTDSTQHIVWTNPGFFKMTGYTKEYAIGKTPRFLQGPNTIQKSKTKIRESLINNTSFTEEVVNYKKNKQGYRCLLQIFPLGEKNRTTHYLALETELR